LTMSDILPPAEYARNRADVRSGNGKLAR